MQLVISVYREFVIADATSRDGGVEAAGGELDGVTGHRPAQETKTRHWRFVEQSRKQFGDERHVVRIEQADADATALEESEFPGFVVPTRAREGDV